jgi:hypothetical protein
MWRYQTAILDIEADNQAVEFEKRYQIYDEDIRGAAAFSAVADNSKGYATALRHDIHLTRTYRKAIDDLRRLRGGNILPKIPVLQNEPKVPGLKSFGYNKNVRWRFPQNPKSPWRQDHDPCRKQSRDRQGAVFLGGAGGFAGLARSRAFLSQLLRARFAGGAKLAVARKETNRCIDGCRLHPDPIY